MATKLKWVHGDLWVGAIRVAESQWTNREGHQWRVAGWDWHVGYETADDAQQDMETEVRRLLKDAGVELE